MKRNTIIYWTATCIMSVIFAFSAGMYYLDYERVASFFVVLGFPTWIIYPLANLKIAGLVAIISRKSKLIKEWAYAGFFFDSLLATSAHLMMGDGQWWAAALALGSVIISRSYHTKVFGS